MDQTSKLCQAPLGNLKRIKIFKKKKTQIKETLEFFHKTFYLLVKIFNFLDLMILIESYGCYLVHCHFDKLLQKLLSQQFRSRKNCNETVFQSKQVE